MACPGLAAEYTWVSNTVAVVSDGTAVLGLGDIGPAAAMPVMEGRVGHRLDGRKLDCLRPVQPGPRSPPGRGGPARLVAATGRSDFPNQINNSLAFPGVFRGALDTRASDITDGMKLAAADAIAVAARACADGVARRP